MYKKYINGERERAICELSHGINEDWRLQKWVKETTEFELSWASWEVNGKKNRKEPLT